MSHNVAVATSGCADYEEWDECPCSAAAMDVASWVLSAGAIWIVRWAKLPAKDSSS